MFRMKELISCLMLGLLFGTTAEGRADEAPYDADLKLARALIVEQLPQAPADGTTASVKLPNIVVSVASLKSTLELLEEITSGESQRRLRVVAPASTASRKTTPEWGLGFATAQNICLEVKRIAPGSPADRKGLRVGDMVYQINGKIVAGIADAAEALENGRCELVGFSPSTGKPFRYVLEANGTQYQLKTSLWLDESVTLTGGLQKSLASQETWELLSADFQKSPTIAQRRLADWLRQGPEVSASESAVLPLSPETRMIIMSKHVLKAQWAMPFDPELTKEGTFGTANTKCRYMTRLNTEFPFAAVTEGTAVELPLEGGRYGLVLMQPPANRDLVAWITPATTVAAWGTLLSRLDKEQRELNLELPRFSHAVAASSKAALEQLGLGGLFLPNRDFQVAEPKAPLYVSDVWQTCQIDWNERGLSASGTATAQIRVFAPAETLRFDRPFIFFVRDKASRSIHFAGVVAQPEELK